MSQQPSHEILISGTGDLRHVLKTLSEECIKDNDVSLNIYVQEPSKEVLARDILLVLLINDKSLPIRERMELYLDIYGNTLMRDRTSAYVSSRIPQLVNFVANYSQLDPTQPGNGLKNLIDLSKLKFKERDELVEIFQSWHQEVQFDIVNLRDQRMRYHYKERYDARVNLADWDYHWGLAKLAPQIHIRHFKTWRNTGVAFEVRLSSYSTPNRTLSGYIPGEKKKTRESVLVRGYWGDITMSPYWAHGVQVDCCENCEMIMNRKVQDQRVHNSMHISEYNIERIVTQLETLQEFHFPPERDRYRQFQANWNMEGAQPYREEEMGDTDFGQYADLELLNGFQKLRVKLFIVADSLRVMCGQSRYREKFDFVYLGMASTTAITEIHQIAKPGGIVVAETLNNLILIKDDEKQVGEQRIRELALENGLTEIESIHNFIKFSKHSV